MACFFTISDFYELEEAESNEPSVKMTNFRTISIDFGPKLAK